jgi:uncharacterized RDD family membrane protein YckC
VSESSDARPEAATIRPGDIIPSTYGRRVAAFLIDGLIGVAFWLLVTMPLIGVGAISVDTTETAFAMSAQSAVLLILPALAYPIVELLLQARLGFSVGKLALGLRIVNISRLGAPGLGWMLLRDLFVAAASLVFFIGQYIVYLSPLWDSEHAGRGWHDRLARTWVIDVKAGPNPLKARPGQLVLDDPAASDAAGTPEPAGFGGGRAFTPGRATAPATAPPVPPTAAERDGASGTTAAVAPSDSAAAPDLHPDATTPVPRAATARTARPVVFRLDTGELVPVTRGGVLGRDPVPPADDPSALLIAVTDDTLSVAPAHLAFGAGAEGFWVRDLGSPGGTAIVRSDGAQLELDPDEQITLEVGDRIRIGTRSIAVEAGA